MPLRVGEQAPEFELESTSGRRFSLNEIAGRPCVLYFYPKDFTSVCTREACSFRDQFAVLRKLDALVFGISRDSLDTHLRFKAEHDLPFDLLADVDGEVAKAYSARIPILGTTKRVTYLLDREHRIAAAHEALFGDEVHVRKMLEALESR